MYRALVIAAPQPLHEGLRAGSVIGLLVVQRPTTGFIEFGADNASARPLRNSATAALSASLNDAPWVVILPLTSALTIASGDSCRSTSGVGALTVLPGAWHAAHERLKTAWPLLPAGDGAAGVCGAWAAPTSVPKAISSAEMAVPTRINPPGGSRIAIRES